MIANPRRCWHMSSIRDIYESDPLFSFLNPAIRVHVKISKWSSLDHFCRFSLLLTSDDLPAPSQGRGKSGSAGEVRSERERELRPTRQSTETTLEAGLEPQEKGKSVLVDLILKFKDA